LEKDCTFGVILQWMIARIPFNSFMYFSGWPADRPVQTGSKLHLLELIKCCKKNNTGNPLLKNEAGELDYTDDFL